MIRLKVIYSLFFAPTINETSGHHFPYSTVGLTISNLCTFLHETSISLMGFMSSLRLSLLCHQVKIHIVAKQRCL